MLVRLAALICALSVATAAAADPLFDTSRLRVGVGDRLALWDGSRARSLTAEAAARGLPLDYVQVWLTRGWRRSWLDPDELAAAARTGAVPVVVHYWFGGAISRERIEASRREWHASLRQMGRLLRGKHPVLVVLEPEFNVAPPPGETATLDWAGFAEELRAAAALVRREAPNARVGVCAGDFPGPPRLEGALGPVAADLDFLAFQEMRAATDPEVGREGYISVGRAARDYAGYLHRAFGKPVLLAYVAVSSRGRFTAGGWEREQAEALEDLARHANGLREAGVFGAVYLQLFDDPAHEGYFGAAERHFGLLRADGSPKPAFAVLRRLARGDPPRAAAPDPR